MAPHVFFRELVGLQDGDLGFDLECGFPRLGLAPRLSYYVVESEPPALLSKDGLRGARLRNNVAVLDKCRAGVDEDALWNEAHKDVGTGRVSKPRPLVEADFRQLSLARRIPVMESKEHLNE